MIALPDIYLFNPTCEMAVGNGSPSWQANQLLRKMEADLGTLPMFFADKNDFVLVESEPGIQFQKIFEKTGLELPTFISRKSALSSESFIHLPKNSLKPWGWSPAAHRLLAPFKESCSDKFKASPVFNWQPGYKNLYSRRFSVDILERLVTCYPNESFIEKEHLPKICVGQSDFEKQIAKWGKIMVKAPWSSSGRGLQSITKTPVHPKVWEKVLGIVADQGFAMAEPFLHKKLDIAFQFRLEKGKVEFAGISNFIADKKGRYTGNHLKGLPDITPETVKTFANKLPELIVPPLSELLEKSDLAQKYEGNFGVDALVFEDTNGRLKVNPCLEINLRQNMGLLSLKLEQLLTPGKKGVFQTWYGAGKSFLDFNQEMEAVHPLKIVDKKIVSGFLPLTEVWTDSEFGAYILV